MTADTEAPVPAHAAIGANQPPLKDRLAIAHQLLLDRVKELVAACARAPDRIDDDTTQGKIGDLYKLLAAAAKKGEAARTDEKEPFLMGGREVDAFFGDNVGKPLTEWMKKLKNRSDLYINAKRDRELRARQEAERLAREEAQRRLEEAQKAEEAGRQKMAEKRLEQAVEADRAAQQAAEAAAATPAEMVQTRGDHSLSTVQMRWTHEVTDWDRLDLEALRDFISRDDLEKAIRAYVRIHKDRKPLAGVRIFEAPNTHFR